MHFTSRTFTLNESRQNPRGALVYLLRRNMRRKDEVSPRRTKGILLHGGPPSEISHRWRGSYSIKHRRMVRTKTPPHHADVRTPKCVVYVSRNPVTFDIYRRRELYLLDQKARETRKQQDYKRQTKCTATTAAKNTVNC